MNPLVEVPERKGQACRQRRSLRGRFETEVAREALARGLHDVVCSHLHSAEFRDVDGILNCSDGDGFESLAARVEHADGRLESWTGHNAPARLRLATYS